MEKVILKAAERKQTTKSATNEIRNGGRVPGVYYSKHDEPIAIDVPEKALNSLVFTKENHLISLNVEGHDEIECVLKDVQFDPITDKVIHFDLLGLTKGEKFQLEVPLQFLGSPVGVKEGGLLQTFMHKLDIECFPKDIPQHLEINIADLKLGDAIHVADLKVENITILNPEDSVIVSITHPKVEKEVAEGEEEMGAEPEVIGKEEETEE